MTRLGFVTVKESFHFDVFIGSSYLPIRKFSFKNEMKIELSNLILFFRGFTVGIIINRLITKMWRNATRKLLDFAQEKFQISARSSFYDLIG